WSRLGDGPVGQPQVTDRVQSGHLHGCPPSGSPGPAGSTPGWFRLAAAFTIVPSLALDNAPTTADQRTGGVDGRPPPGRAGAPPLAARPFPARTASACPGKRDSPAGQAERARGKGRHASAPRRSRGAQVAGENGLSHGAGRALGTLGHMALPLPGPFADELISDSPIWTRAQPVRCRIDRPRSRTAAARC